jgi:hypothetical protein
MDLGAASAFHGRQTGHGRARQTRQTRRASGSGSLGASFSRVVAKVVVKVVVVVVGPASQAQAPVAHAAQG